MRPGKAPAQRHHRGFLFAKNLQAGGSRRGVAPIEESIESAKQSLLHVLYNIACDYLSCLLPVYLRTHSLEL